MHIKDDGKVDWDRSNLPYKYKSRPFETQTTNVKTITKAALGVWMIGVLVSLTVTGVSIWAVIKIVLWLTAV